MPWSTHRLWPGVFGGAPAHDLHHQQGGHSYQQLFLWMGPMIKAAERAAPNT